MNNSDAFADITRALQGRQSARRMKSTVIQHFSPSTKDTLTIVVTPIEEQITWADRTSYQTFIESWMNAHPDFVYLGTFDLPDWTRVCHGLGRMKYALIGAFLTIVVLSIFWFWAYEQILGKLPK